MDVSPAINHTQERHLYSTPKSPIVKHCQQCGAEFTAFHSNRKYCTDCIIAKGRAVITRTCERCGCSVEVILSDKTKADRTRRILCHTCRHAETQIATTLVCVDCGCRFERTGKRGRMANRCPTCRKQNRRHKELQSKCRKCGRPCNEGSRQCKRCAAKPGARVRLEPKPCEICGETFQPKTVKNKYCRNPQCAIEGRRRALDRRLGHPNRYVCLYCGETYKAKKKNRDTFCCREHAFAWRRENPVLGPLPATAAEQRRCEVCGGPAASAPSKTCGSEECKRTRYLEAAAARSTRDRKPRACKECGEVFIPEYGNKRSAFCSHKCMRKQGRRIAKSIRKARLRNASRTEAVDPLAVFKRDGWRCKLCGCRTPKRLRGTTDDRAPELDHIVPLAHGGAHSYANTQCLCRKCNREKGASVAGQLPLV